MPFLPSLLEYSPQALELRLQSITQYPSEFQAIQKSPDDKIYLHLDFVLAHFADSRSVEPGNSPQVVFGMIDKYFRDQEVVCNSHFMGLGIDMDEVLKFFETYDWNPNWKYILYVGREFVGAFVNRIKTSIEVNPSHLQCQSLIKEQFPIEVVDKLNLKIGVWLDFDQYNVETKFEIKDYLLMTVLAGKSGQKLTEQVRLDTLEIILQNPDVNFTVDGGWTVTDQLAELNLEQQKTLDVISYSNFWKEFAKLIAN